MVLVPFFQLLAAKIVLKIMFIHMFKGLKVNSASFKNFP